jgi:WD40 repeat protein
MVQSLTSTLEVRGGPLVRTLEGHTDTVNAVAVTPGWPVCRLRFGSDDNRLKLCELETGRQRRMLQGYIGWVLAAVVTLDGPFVLFGSGNDTLKVWEQQKSRLLATFCGEGAFWCRAINLHNRLFVACDVTGHVHLLPLEGVGGSGS